MNRHLISSGGASPAIVDTHVVALYDAKSGKIAHLHAVTVFEGARKVSEKEAIDAARAQATKLGHHVDALKSAVSKDAAIAARPHRIDVASGRFIALRAPPMKRRTAD
jgi:hypothetical protein